MATPFPFVAGAVLTAANLNAITELVTNTQTDDYTLAATDAGDRVIANKATAITFTVPNSVFSASQIVRIHNIGAGTLTISAGAGLTLNGADVLTLAQYQGGELFFTSASSAIFFPTAKTVAAAGLEFVTGATFTTATSFSLPDNTFSATYRAYRMIVNITAVTSDADFTMRLRGSGSDITLSDYVNVLQGLDFGGTASNITTFTQSSWNAGEQDATAVRYDLVCDILNPQATAVTQLDTWYSFVNKAGNNVIVRQGLMQYDQTTSVDSLSFISSVASSITGTYRVYGYADS